MRLTASDLYTRYRPSSCGLRVYLSHRGEPAAPTSPFVEVLRILGERHERAHLAGFGTVVDLRDGEESRRLEATRAHIATGSPVIYQAAFSAEHVLAGVACTIRGDPDFLIQDGSGYVIRDCKISLRITEKAHTEILQQLELYGWLYERATGNAPKRLEVLNGREEIVVVEYDGGQRVLGELESIVGLKQSQNEPLEPVGWTKCSGCPYRARCWSGAEERGDVALVPGIDQSLARTLYDEGTDSIESLLAKYDVEGLSEVRKPRGAKLVRVGKAAESILLSAACLAEKGERVIGPPGLPDGPNLVMFDLEGLPPHLDELDKVFLWGMQVFGQRPSEFRAALAGFGDAGDHEGWERFLDEAQRIFDEYGDLPFIHWHHYERTKLRMYVKRYGDPQGIAARVEENLVDLFPITQKSIVLPISSYSLKVVERYVGFERQIEEGRGDWAMAKYIEACETDDEETRTKVMDEVLEYNREDLEATWAVFEWLRRRFATV